MSEHAFEPNISVPISCRICGAEKRFHGASAREVTPPAPGSRNWLIYDRRSECYWGPNRAGYFKSIASAGLYTEVEARAEEDFANRYGRQEVAIPLSKFGEEIRRLYAALTEREAEDLLLGPAVPAPPSAGEYR